MSLPGEVLRWFTTAEHWRGDFGVPHRLTEHVLMSIAAVVAAAVLALPVGIRLGHRGRGGALAVNLANVGRAVPSLAILALAQQALGLSGWPGFGARPAFIALVALAVPPLITNAYIGMRGVDRDVVEAATGMGMTGRELLWQVELPIALPLVMAGLRTAAVQVVATATLAAVTAWGGLGRYIVDGFGQRDNAQIVAGALLVGLLALVTELGLGRLQRAIVSEGLRSHGLASPRSGPAGRVGVEEEPAAVAAMNEGASMGPRSIRMRTAGAVLVVAAVTAACGSSSTKTTANASKTVVIGSAPFSENEIVANMYAGALQNAGFQVTVRKGLGQREIYLPALQKGGKDNGIDLVPEYVGTLLEYVNKNAGEASGDLDATTGKLRSRLDTLGLTALNPSPAQDQNAFAVSKATADRLKAKKLSDLTPAASQLTLGAGPECPTRPFCQPGLEKTYGLRFKAFRVLDSGGPKTLDALTSGDIDVGLVFSSDGGVAAKNLVVLEDDKKLQTVDNIVPAIRKDVVDDTITSVLNKVSAALNTPDLTQLNKRADVDKEDPETLAREWLGQHGFTKKK